MRAKSPFQLTAIGLATILATCALTIPPAAAADSVAAACATVESIFARGSGQGPRDSEAERFESQIRNRLTSPSTLHHYNLGSETVDGYSYPAVPVGMQTGLESLWNTVQAGISGGEGYTYGTSVNEGVDELNAYLTKRAAACPEALFVLGGYSQGAQVVGEAYNDKLSDSLRRRVVYQALLATPSSFSPRVTAIYLAQPHLPALMRRQTLSGASTFRTARSSRAPSALGSRIFPKASLQPRDCPAHCRTSYADRAECSGTTRAI
ncbi:cutinase family protein [Arthrobacter sp. ISL-69]|uniref:cutinase family protein n=1 Tax=Arthrobacter sp. ISL-69 TaxID=2819113 RepID=UPI001BEAA897|nr:cutinase family protein [Arthrobacter sp. ISL-69]